MQLSTLPAATLHSFSFFHKKKKRKPQVCHFWTHVSLLSLSFLCRYFSVSLCSISVHSYGCVSYGGWQPFSNYYSLKPGMKVLQCFVFSNKHWVLRVVDLGLFSHILAENLSFFLLQGDQYTFLHQCIKR